MHILVIDLIGPCTQKSIQVPNGPYGMLPRLYGLGHLPYLLHDLTVAQQVVDELRIAGTKQSLTDRAVVWLGPGTGRFGAMVVGHQCLKVDTAKIGATIDNNRLWKSAVAAHRLTKHHHGRAIAWWIKG